jgi:hypothetical protein
VKHCRQAGRPWQLFMALLDGDRFEVRYREGVLSTDTSDLMRRMVKEDLLKFDCTPLFPRAPRVHSKLQTFARGSAFYDQVTDYVREEFNRANALQQSGTKGTVGFALTILQRRLASSPEAIYQSLRRRPERLEKRLREEQLQQRARTHKLTFSRDLTSLPPMTSMISTTSSDQRRA